MSSNKLEKFLHLVGDLFELNISNTFFKNVLKITTV